MSIPAPRENVRVVPPVERYEREAFELAEAPHAPRTLRDRLGWFGVLLGYGLVGFLLYRLWAWMR